MDKSKDPTLSADTDFDEVGFVNQVLETESTHFVTDNVSVDGFNAIAFGLMNAASVLDAYKKAIFYNPQGEKLEKIQPLLGIAEDMAIKMASAGNMIPEQCRNEPSLGNVDSRILHAVMGKITEAVEMLEPLLKTINDKTKPVDTVNLLEEFADGMWYDGVFLDATQTRMSEHANTLREKLQKKRYKNGFNSKDSLDRDLAGERKALEQATQ